MFYYRVSVTHWLTLAVKYRYVCVHFGYCWATLTYCVVNLQDEKREMEGCWNGLVVS